MTRPTLPGATRPLISAGSLDGGGGTIVGPVESGLVPTSTGSNSWLWLENVRRITANGSNTIMGPFVNVAAGSNIILTVDQFPASTPSNTLRIHSTGGGGGGSLTVEDEGTPLSTSATTLNFVGAGVTASGTGATKTITIPGGGSSGLVLLEQHTASSSAELVFDSFYSTTYDNYLITIVGLIPATDNVTLRMQLSTDGGSTWITSNDYFSGHAGIANGGGSFNLDSNGVSAWVLGTGVDNSSARGFSGTLYLQNLASATVHKSINGHVSYSNQTNVGGAVFYGLLVDAADKDAFKIFASSGNLASGTVRVYGLEK